MKHKNEYDPPPSKKINIRIGSPKKKKPQKNDKNIQYNS